MEIDLSFIAPEMGYLAQGALLTLEVCFWALIGSLVMGALGPVDKRGSQITG